MAVGFPEEFIKSISIRNRDVSSEGLKGIGDLWEYESLKNDIQCLDWQPLMFELGEKK